MASGGGAAVQRGVVSGVYLRRGEGK